jgi:hypothetical protein
VVGFPVLLLSGEEEKRKSRDDIENEKPEM